MIADRTKHSVSSYRTRPTKIFENIDRDIIQVLHRVVWLGEYLSGFVLFP